MKTIVVTVLVIVLGLQIQNIQPQKAQYIEIERIEPYSGKNIRPIIVSTEKLTIELSYYEKEAFKKSLLNDTNEFIRFQYNLLKTNTFTYRILKKYIYKSKSYYSNKNEKFGYLITINNISGQKYFFVPDNNATYFFNNAYSYLRAKKCDSIFCKNIYYR